MTSTRNSLSSGARCATRSSPFDRNRRKLAKRRGRELANSYELWFRNKYQLAPTDPRFLSATAEEIEAEYWAYQYQDNKVQDEIEDEDFDLAAVLAEFEEQAGAVPPVDATDDDWEEVTLG